MIENARRRADGQSRGRPRGRRRRPVEPLQPGRPRQPRRVEPPAHVRGRTSAGPAPGTSPLAWPYNKWHNSQWNVDQAACLILCSVEAARAHGVPADRWVFPLAIAQSNHMVPVSRRAADPPLARVRRGRARRVRAGGSGHRRRGPRRPVQLLPDRGAGAGARARPPAGPAPTVTGGMTFGGGPLNNYVLQSTARMAQVLRDDPSAAAWSLAISGMITKQGGRRCGRRRRRPRASGRRTYPPRWRRPHR